MSEQEDITPEDQTVTWMDGDYERTLSTYGVVLGARSQPQHVIAHIDGALCVHQYGQEPYAYNFGAYMMDILPQIRMGKARIAKFNEVTGKYEIVGHL